MNFVYGQEPAFHSKTVENHKQDWGWNTGLCGKTGAVITQNYSYIPIVAKQRQ